MRPLTTPSEVFGDHELLRYSRQILLPEIDLEGQKRLAASRVLIVGLGGLGCPAAQYLVAAGVGHLVLCDGDVVEVSNLQRQILFSDVDIGQHKAIVAASRLSDQNPGVSLSAIPERADAALLAHHVPDVDLVLDCSDNFATRHAVNRACLFARKPLVSAAAVRFEGQVAVFDFREEGGPCYACLYPAGEATTEDTCSRNGVLGPLLGMLGSMQALEAVRLLAGGRSPLAGQVLLLDAKNWEWRRIALPRDPHCGACAHDR